jgi:hypothetical protein
MKKYRIAVFPVQAGDTIEINDGDIVQVLPPLNELSQYDCRVVVLSQFK